MKIFALSGLTECGKLEAATYMRGRGVAPFKIGDLLEAVQAREGDSGDFQEWNFRQEKERPGWLIQQFHNELVDRLARLGGPPCSIDSLYGPVLAERLRRLTEPEGRQVVVVYIDASPEARLARQLLDPRLPSLEEAKRILAHKDANKIAKGNLQVRRIADEVIDNSDSLKAFHQRLDDMLVRHGCLTTDLVLGAS